MNFDGEGSPRMTANRAKEPEQALAEARSLAARMLQLLNTAQRYEVIPYLRQVMALIETVEGPKGASDNRTTLFLLHMALALLDRDGEIEAAGDVEGALLKLGQSFPELTDIEANARIDRWIERRAARKSKAAQGNQTS